MEHRRATTEYYPPVHGPCLPSQRALRHTCVPREPTVPRRKWPSRRLTGEGTSCWPLCQARWEKFLGKSILRRAEKVKKNSVQFSRSVVSDSSRPHEPQHTRPPCPSPTPGVHPNSCPLSWWCHPAISSSVIPLLLLPSIFPSIRVFSNESALHIRWPKYRSFSFNISPSNEHPGLISFRMDWLDLLAVPGTLKSLLQHHS